MLRSAGYVLHITLMLFVGMTVAVAVSGGNWFFGIIAFLFGAGLYWFVVISLVFVYLMITKELEGDSDGL